MYYIRKLSKPSALFKLRDMQNIKEIDADFLGQELRTKSNTLSVWRSETLNPEQLNKAIHAALLASSQINVAQFIILDSESLSHVGISTDDSEPGVTGYKGFEYLHTNICNLTYEKVGSLLELLQNSSKLGNRTPLIGKAKFKEIIIEINNNSLLNIDVMDAHMQKEVSTLLSKASSA